jgi:serine/threonine kinase 16
MERSSFAVVSSFCINIIDIIKSFLQSFRSESVIINGKTFIILRCLGEGGFSYVYLVRDPINNAQFALKRMRIQLKEQEQYLKKEIEAHRLVSNSRFVITLVDSAIIYNGQTAVEGLLLLPYFSAGTCQDIIDRTSPAKIPLIQILSLTADICRGIYKSVIDYLGLAAFHAKGLAFRDLKVSFL